MHKDAQAALFEAAAAGGEASVLGVEELVRLGEDLDAAARVNLDGMVRHFQRHTSCSPSLLLENALRTGERTPTGLGSCIKRSFCAPACSLLRFAKVDGRTALHVAASRGHIDMLHCLVRLGADVNGRAILDGCVAQALARKRFGPP